MEIGWIALIALPLIGIALGFWRAYRDASGETSDYALFGFMGAIAGFSAWLACVLVLASVGPVQDSKWQADLRAIGTDDRVSGSFFLGSGTIDGERVFNYTYMAEDGGTKIDSVEADKSTIYENATEDSANIVQEAGYRNAWFFGTESAPWLIYERWSIHIPAGSVYEGYEVK